MVPMISLFEWIISLINAQFTFFYFYMHLLCNIHILLMNNFTLTSHTHWGREILKPVFIISLSKDISMTYDWIGSVRLDLT